MSKIGKKGQIVIPKEIRDKLHIKPNDIFNFQVQSRTILIKKVPDTDDESLIEILKKSKKFPNSSEFVAQLRNEWS